MVGTLRILVAATGVTIVGIALAHLILGGAAVVGGSPLNATAEGEHRFFAALLLSFGFAFLWCARDIDRKRRPLDFLAGTLLLGGVARLASIAVSGPPNAFYSVMLVIELVVPLALFAMASKLPQPS